jgi:pimeloyl-ACP methyl ester carboxylesterase
MTRAARNLAMSLVALLVVASGVAAWYVTRRSPGHPSELTPRDPTLRVSWLYFYPSRAAAPARAFVVLFGNDVAFWEPHQDLAWRLAGDGYSVVGVDLKQFFVTLPSKPPARDTAFAAAMPNLIQRARHELNADDLPLVLGGHSLGAEVALWIAEHTPPPKLVGVLAINSRSTSHLNITLGDLLNTEPKDRWSFSTIDAVRHLEPGVRVAIVRGGHDPFRSHDSAFAAAGGARLRRYEIAMAGHALKTMVVAWPVITRAMRFLVEGTAT